MMNVSFNFSHPWLLLLALFPLAIFLYASFRARNKSLAVPLSSYVWISKPKGTHGNHRVVPRTLRLLAVLSLLPVLAGIGAEIPDKASRRYPSGLMIVLDGSSSMTAEDFQPDNRLQEAKKDLKVFVSQNPDVEIGLISFAATAQLLVPVTPDHEAAQRALDGISPAAYGEDGTAIGSGIASAVNRLRNGSWPQRSILLITDGVNNRGAVSPLDAARLAKELGISIHAIGIGTDELSRYFVPRAEGGSLELRARIEIDDEALLALARESGGTYRRVKSSVEFAQALSQIRPGMSEPQTFITFKSDPKWPLSLASLCLLLLGAEFILAYFVLSEIPG